LIKAIVTDIEGTTSDIRFVHQVLFPYARERLAGYLRQHAGQAVVAQALDDLRREIGQPAADLESLIGTLFSFMDQDRKSTALKALQGMIWRDGYRQGDFFGHLYPDVAPRLEAWQRQGIRLYVYSSGSVQAQQLLFGYSDAGDLRPLLSGYFDTRIGAKREVAAYRAIAGELDLPPEAILFLSDITQELDAARSAGWLTCRLVREPLEPGILSTHPQVNRFNQIDLQEIAP